MRSCKLLEFDWLILKKKKFFPISEPTPKWNKAQNGIKYEREEGLKFTSTVSTITSSKLLKIFPDSVF